MPLTVKGIQALKPAIKTYRKADGNGLCIEVQPNGSKHWRYRYRWLDKPTMVSVGPFPAVSLQEARDKHSKLSSLLRSGINPAESRRDAKLAQREASANTFEGVGREWMAKHRCDKAPATRTKDEWLLGHAFKAFGSKPVATVNDIHVKELLAKLQNAGTLETARRVRERCSSVFNFALGARLVTTNPVLLTTGFLPRPVVRSHSAITDPQMIGALLRKVDGYGGQPATVAAMKLMALTFLRPKELRYARWDEFNFETNEWTVPGERMKREHRLTHPDHWIPLAPQAVAILSELRKLTGRGKLVFPCLTNAKKPLSENTINAALRSMGFDKHTMTSHGYRSMASTRLNELGFDHDVIERQMAHKEKNEVRAAYHRSSYLEQRRQMMNKWADYLDTLREGKPDADKLIKGQRFESREAQTADPECTT
ncbi:MAG: tyrosine-type recombinase/integrase [Pseudomarimonas sp.]